MGFLSMPLSASRAVGMRYGSWSSRNVNCNRGGGRRVFVLGGGGEKQDGEETGDWITVSRNA